MKSYLLLRDNQQSGPYTVQELQQKGLYSLDLLWIEGESIAWQYPNEIQELTGFIKSRRTMVKKKPSTTGSSTTVATNYQPVTQTTAVSSAVVDARSMKSTRDYYPYENVNKELYADIKYSSPKRRLSLNGNLMGLFLIVIGAAMAAFIVRNIVGTFGNEPSAPISQAREITTEKLSSENTSAAFQPADAHASMTGAPLQAVPMISAPQPAAPIATEPKVTPVASEPVNDQQSIDQDINQKSKGVKQDQTDIKKQDDAPATTTIAITDADSKTEVKQDPPKEKKIVKDVRSMVHLSANDYKVGVLGGISKLELQVTNDSPKEVDNATVEVNYLKPNGDVVKTETLQIHDLQPGKSKRVQAPSSSRGVKVAYRIVDAS